MAGLVDLFVLRAGGFAVALRGDDAGLANGLERLDEALVGIEGFVGQQGIRPVRATTGRRRPAGRGQPGVRAKRTGLPRASTRVWILVLESLPLLPADQLDLRRLLGAGAMLMSAHDGAVDHGVFVVRIGRKARTACATHRSLPIG